MKKLILLLIAGLFVFGANAQDKSKAKTLQKGQYYFNFSLGSADNLTPTADTYGVLLLANKAEPVKYDIEIVLDSISGTPATEVKLQGKVFEDDAWTDITTVNWAATSADTTILFQEHSTAAYYRYLNIAIDMDETGGNEALLTKAEFKLWDK